MGGCERRGEQEAGSRGKDRVETIVDWAHATKDPLDDRWIVEKGILTFGAYWLTLWVYQMADRAGYVVAFRQLSIVIGVVAASRLFGERGAAIRITAACLVCAGLVIVGLLG